MSHIRQAKTETTVQVFVLRQAGARIERQVQGYVLAPESAIFPARVIGPQTVVFFIVLLVHYQRQGKRL